MLMLMKLLAIGIMTKSFKLKLTRLLVFFIRYNKCHSSNLNGYNFGKGIVPGAFGISWKTFTTHNSSLARVEMAIKGKHTLN